MSAWEHGALLAADGKSTRFRVWAPLSNTASLVLPDRDVENVPMVRQSSGYYELTLADCPAGTRYLFEIDGTTPRPDPASRWQPDGVHGPSAVLNTHFDWTASEWTGRPLEEYVIYEFHVGTLTADGTFDAAIAELPRLKELGITAVEVMPIAEFPGDRNWGYDGVFMYAAQQSYGGLSGFQRFVDAAHKLQLAVVLDVVYNHLGPEGNYLSCFGPYFTEKYHTPWGSSLNFDGAHSDGVRDFFVGNAIFWTEHCQVDALRLDAVHAIIDESAYPFLRRLSDECHALGRHLRKPIYVIGENERNDPLFVTATEMGGVGADSQWNDDFHHALHTVLTGESHGYYKDYGKVSQLAKAYTDGFIFDGCYSTNRACHYGADSRHLDGIRFVICSQNHDQVGNRPIGERLSMILEFPQLKLAAVALLTAPAVPLIFMGEETAAKSPFLYFVSHSDPSLIDGVREGRKKEFREFFATGGDPPDPQAEKTFLQSKVKPDTSKQGKAITDLYTTLLRLRKEISALRPGNKRRTFAEANDHRRTLVISRHDDESTVLCLFNFAEAEQIVTVPAAEGEWSVLLDTDSKKYEGSGNRAASAMKSSGEMRIPMPGGSAVLLQLCHTTALTNTKTMKSG